MKRRFLDNREPQPSPDALSRYREMSERDLLITAVTKMERAEQDSADHETRLRALENIRNWFGGALAAVGGIVTAHLEGWIGKG